MWADAPGAAGRLQPGHAGRRPFSEPDSRRRRCRRPRENTWSRWERQSPAEYEGATQGSTEPCTGYHQSYVHSPAPVAISHMYTALHRLPSVICTQPCTGCDQSWNTKMPHVHMLGAASRDTPRRQPGSLPSRIARLDDCTREQAVVSPSLFRQIVKSKGHAIERTCSRLSHTVL
jgi:hypothetical protein